MNCTIEYKGESRATFDECSIPGFDRHLFQTKDGSKPSGLLVPKPITLTSGTVSCPSFPAWVNESDGKRKIAIKFETHTLVLNGARATQRTVNGADVATVTFDCDSWTVTK